MYTGLPATIKKYNFWGLNTKRYYWYRLENGKWYKELLGEWDCDHKDIRCEGWDGAHTHALECSQRWQMAVAYKEAEGDPTILEARCTYAVTTDRIDLAVSDYDGYPHFHITNKANAIARKICGYNPFTDANLACIPMPEYDGSWLETILKQACDEIKAGHETP